MVHPSKHESFGLIFLEAFANDLGVIALESSGGAREVVGEAGILVRENTSEEFAKAILELSTSLSQREVFVNEGKRRLEWFSKEAVTERYLALYKEVLLR
jgi:glycosyltransferase involved in cell wall biosynthesis